MNVREMPPIDGRRCWLVETSEPVEGGGTRLLDHLVGEMPSIIVGHITLYCPSCDSGVCEHTAAVREVIDASEGMPDGR